MISVSSRAAAIEFSSVDDSTESTIVRVNAESSQATRDFGELRLAAVGHEVLQVGSEPKIQRAIGDHEIAEPMTAAAARRLTE